MSIELVKKEIERFITSPQPAVICIKGAWGVGKTYSWNECLRNAQHSRKLACGSYSYVSLFGLNSFEQLKYAIFENSVSDSAIGSAPSLKSITSNNVSIANRWRKSLGWLSIVPKAKDFAAVLQSVAFLSVRDRLICIDDIERKGAHLAVKDVLGLVSQLADQRGCKIALILNDGALQDRDEEDFAQFNEKVIDVVLQFSPTSEECISVVLPDQSVVWRRDLAVILAHLGLSNIRIIAKIFALCERITPLLVGFHPNVLAQAVISITVLAWSEYDKDRAPSFEFLKGKRPLQAMGFDKEKTTDNEVRWNGLLDDIGFTNLDEFDLVLHRGITQGYLDEELLLTQASALGDRVKHVQADEAFSRAWRLFHDSLEDNQDEVSRELFRTFCDNAKNVTPVNASGTIAMLKTLGAREAAQEALQHYMRVRDDEPYSFFDLDASPFGNEVQDEELRAAFADKLGSLVQETSPQDALLKIGDTGDWSRSDILLLSKVSADEFGHLFQKCSGPNLRKIVRAVLSFKQTVGETSVAAKVSDTARAALVNLARRSIVNRLRLKRYGIDIDDSEQI